MKLGAVYRALKSRVAPDTHHDYVVIYDYGKVRIVNLTGICKMETNSGIMIAPKALDVLCGDENEGFYKGDVKIADSLEEYYEKRMEYQFLNLEDLMHEVPGLASAPIVNQKLLKKMPDDNA